MLKLEVDNAHWMLEFDSESLSEAIAALVAIQDVLTEEDDDE